METKSSKTNMKSSNLVALLLLTIGLVIGALAIAAIPETQNLKINTILVVILVLLVFMGGVSLVNCIINKSCKDNYEVNKDAEKGKENTAFDHADDSKKNGVDSKPTQQQNGNSTLQTVPDNDEKWDSNYVPFGDYPKGNIVYVKEYVPQDLVNDLNGVEVINEEPIDWQQNQINKTYYN